MINKDGVFEYINPKFKELFGYDLSDIPDGKTWFRKAFPDSTYRHEVIEAWINDLKSSKTGEKRSRVFKAFCKNGKETIVNFISVQLEKGEQLMACEDITERKHTEEALRESEERYRTILENIEDGYYEVDLHGDFTFFNDSLCRMLGYSRNEILGMGNQQYTDEVNRKKLFGAFNEVYRTGKPTKEFGWEVFRKDGTKLFGEVSVSLIKDPTGKPIGFRGIARDITERKRAEEEIRQTLSLLNATLESTADGILVVNRNGKIESFNRRFVQMWRIPEPIIASKDDDQALTFVMNQLKDPEGFLSKVKELYSNPAAESFDLIEFKDGRFFERYSLPQWVGDLCVGRVWSFRDVTERKKAEESLRTEKLRLQSLSENSPFGMVMIDKDGTFQYINPKFRELFGYDLTDIPNGKTWFRKAYPDPAYRHEVISAWITDLNSSKTGEKRSQIFTVNCKDGTERIINFIPVQLDTGENLMACEDITQQNQAEQEMKVLEEQFRQSQKMEAVGRLAGGIAHDFNNLLTVIKGYSQLSLLDLSENDPLWGNIQEIQKATQRAADLTRQLLAFSRRQILDLKVLDLNTLLRDLNKMLRRIISEDIELVTLLAEDLGRVKIDPGQFEQMILNLAVNARDAMPSGGKLTIETANIELDEEYAHSHISVIPGHYVQLSITDTGVGILPDIKEKVFEPFFTTKDKGKGTGLGLSTVYGIVKQSGGNIWVYSEPGHGTTFKIYLPRVEEELDSALKREETDFLPRGNETVLLVEDDPSVRDLAHRLLIGQGYKVLEAANGEEALRVAQENIGEKIHLLLTDVVMPQMGGKELSEKLKQLRPDIGVLYTSGYTDNAIVHHGTLESGTNFLQKPFSPKTLSHKVREVLDQ
jgi:PAS domain S-box-containing protein